MPSGIASTAVVPITHIEPRIAARAPPVSGSTLEVYWVKRFGVQATVAVEERRHQQGEETDHGERDGQPQGHEEGDRGTAALARVLCAKGSGSDRADAGHQYASRKRRTSRMLMMLMISVMVNSRRPTANRVL